MTRCLYCEKPLIGKRPHALYCDDLCGRGYRGKYRYMSHEARCFWEGVRRVTSRSQRMGWTRRAERLVGR